MGIKRKLKDYFNKRKKLKVLKTNNIINIKEYSANNKTIVFISKVFPAHDKDSGSNRIKEIILQYKKLGFNCIICVEKIFEDNFYVQFYKKHNCIVFVESFKHKSIYDFLKNIPKVDFYWFNGAESFDNYFSKIKKISPNSMSIYDMVDIHFLRIKRAIELNPTSTSLQKEYKKFYEIETQLSRRADKIIAISEKEGLIISEFVDSSKIVIISNIHYPKIKKEERKSFENSKDILFIGSFHDPNIDAIDFLYKEIMPKVWDYLPAVKVNIIGNVMEKLDVSMYPKFNFLGFLEDVENYFKENKIMVAPLRYGAGVKGKIGQAFEFYLPVVTTEIGAEGMNLVNNQNALVLNNANDFADAIIKLNNDKKLWETLSQNSEESLKPFLLANVSEKIKTL